MRREWRTLPFTGPALAAEIQGTLRSVHPVAGQIVFDGGSTLAVDADTQIRVAGKPGGLEDLQPGEEVKAAYQEENGQNVATRPGVIQGSVSNSGTSG